MAKEKEQEQEQQAQQPAAEQQATTTALAAEETTSKPIDVLREKGKVTLYAETREQLQKDALELIAAAEGKAFSGAAGYNATKGHTIIITLKKD